MSSSRCRSHSADATRAASPYRLARAGRKRAGVGLASIVSLVALALPTSALADGTVPLGTADSFAVLAGTSVTNTGPSVINGDLGVDPGTSVTGFSSAPTDGMVNGSTHVADATATQAKSDLSNAYGVAAGLAPTAPQVTVPADIGGQTLTAGVYKYSSSLAVTGTLTLDGQGKSDGVFVFQAGSTLTTASASHVSFINGAQPCHVFWQVGSSATLGTGSVFVGNILAATSITLNSSVTVAGRTLAGTGDVTLINDTINRADCTTPTTVGPTGTPVTGGPTGTPVTGGPTGTPVTGGPAGTPTTGGRGTPTTGGRGKPTTGGPTGTPIGSKTKTTAGKRREARARARAKARAEAQADTRARARANARRAAPSSPARPPAPKNHGGFTG